MAVSLRPLTEVPNEPVVDRVERRFEPPGLDLLHHRIVSSIFRALVEGHLKPGERLKEEAIAMELGVSRTPVRRALEEMALQGVLVMVPRRGVRVADWSLDDLQDLVRVRVVLEGLAATQAASRVDDADLDKLSVLADNLLDAIAKGDHKQANEADASFHASLVLSSKNTGLISAYGSLTLRIRMLLILEKQVYGSDTRYRDVAEHHRAICSALRAHDAALARELVEENLDLAGKALLESLRDRSKTPEETSVHQMMGQLLNASDGHI